MRKNFNSLFYIGVFKCRDLEEGDIVLNSKLESLLRRHLSDTLVCIINIIFIAQQKDHTVFSSQLLGVIEPDFDIFKARAIAHIIYNDSPFCIPIMTGCHCMVFLFSSCVEETQFYLNKPICV